MAFFVLTAVIVETTSSPSWVTWNEIEVGGTPR
jgi:hypothetical protein